MNHRLIYAITVVMGLMCFSCQHSETYYHFYELKDAKWSKYDTLFFEIDSTDIRLDVPFDLEIEMINNSDYPYQNIWLYVQDNFSTETDKKEIQYQLADDLGKWYGSGFGSSYQEAFGYKKNIIFKEKRNYRMKVVQGMRDEPLYGIEKVGVKLFLSGGKTTSFP